MVASGGRLLIPQAWRTIRFAVDKTSKAVRERISELKAAQSNSSNAHGRTVPKQPVHRAAAIRQSQSRWYSTQRAVNSAFERTVRQFSSSARIHAKDRTSYPKSRTSHAVSQLTSRAPFASTLRPNLTGGALHRTAGGYGLGSGRIGGARYFSHTPAAPAEVVNNVSAAVRAFWISGQRAQYDGIHPRLGERRYRAISALQDEATRKMRLSSPLAPGSFIDFKLSPSITAFGSLSSSFRATGSQYTNTLSSSEILNNLSVDFARAIKDLAVVQNDLYCLSSLGDLPVSLSQDSTVRVRFPGCDVETVERLCDEVGVRRGIIRQDPEFDASAGTEMALLFPFAPSGAPTDSNSSVPPIALNSHEQIAWQNMLASEAAPISIRSIGPTKTDYSIEDVAVNPWLSSPSEYSSAELVDDQPEEGQSLCETTQLLNRPSDYEGLEGVCRFLAECELARR